MKARGEQKTENKKRTKLFLVRVLLFINKSGDRNLRMKQTGPLARSLESLVAENL